MEDLMKLMEEDDHLTLFKLPSDWKIGIQDKGLLSAVSEQGINFLKDIKFSHEYGLHACRINQKRLLRRVEFLCHYFKNISNKKGNNASSISSCMGVAPIKASNLV